MSWLFSRVLVEDYLPDRCLDTDVSVPSSGSHTRKPCLWLDKMMEHFPRSQFGMTFALLTADRGEELLKSYRGAFHVRTLVQPDEVQELMGSDQECGDRWRGSLAKYDPNTFLWKIPQCSLLEDSGECLEIWPRSGMTRDGLCWELPTLGRRTKETESGFWPTPQASDNRNRGNADTPAIARRIAAGKQVMLTMTVSGGQLNPGWVEWLMGWPIGHTDLKPLATDKCPSAPQQHGDC